MLRMNALQSNVVATGSLRFACISRTSDDERSCPFCEIGFAINRGDLVHALYEQIGIPT